MSWATAPRDSTVLGGPGWSPDPPFLAFYGKDEPERTSTGTPTRAGTRTSTGTRTRAGTCPSTGTRTRTRVLVLVPVIAQVLV